MSGRDDSGSPFPVPELDTTLQHAPPPPTQPAPPPGRGGKSRALLAILATAALVGGAGVTAALVAGGGEEGSSGGGNPDVVPTRVERDEVPAVVGKSREEAERTLREAGFDVETRSVASHAPAGQVAAQHPEGGELARAGETVVLEVSAG